MITPPGIHVLGSFLALECGLKLFLASNDYGKHNGVSIPRLGHIRLISVSLAPPLACSFGRSQVPCCELPLEEVQVARNGRWSWVTVGNWGSSSNSLQGTGSANSYWVGLQADPAPVEPSDNCKPGQHLDCGLVRVPGQRTLLEISLGFQTRRILR